MLYRQMITILDRELDRVREIFLLRWTSNPSVLRPCDFLYGRRDGHAAGPRSTALLLVGIGCAISRLNGDLGGEACAGDFSKVQP